MRQGKWKQRNDGKIGAAPKKYPQELRDRLKRRYLTLRVLGYHKGKEFDVIDILAATFNLPRDVVVYLLQKEGVR